MHDAVVLPLPSDFCVLSGVQTGTNVEQAELLVLLNIILFLQNSITLLSCAVFMDMFKHNHHCLVGLFKIPLLAKF